MLHKPLISKLEVYVFLKNGRRWCSHRKSKTGIFSDVPLPWKHRGTSSSRWQAGPPKMSLIFGYPKGIRHIKFSQFLENLQTQETIKTISELLVICLKVHMGTNLLRSELEAWFEKVHAFVHRSYTYTWATLCSDLHADWTARHRLVWGQRHRDLRTRNSWVWNKKKVWTMKELLVKCAFNKL